MHSRRQLTASDLEGRSDDLRERTLSGVRWMTYARVGLQVASVLSTIVVARLVPPHEYGQAVAAMALWSIANVLGAEAYSPAIVQRKQLDRQTLEAAAFLSGVCGLLLGVAAATLGAALMGRLVDGPTGDLTRLIAPCFVLPAFAMVPTAILSRRLDFKQLAINEALGLCSTIAVTVSLAIAGLGATAVVLGAVAGSAVAAAAAFATSPAVMPRPHRGPAPRLLRFVAPLQASSLLYSAQRFGPAAAVASLLGSSAAGLFQRGYALGMEYQTKVSGIMLTVAFPVYSRTQDFSRAIAIRRRIVRLHSSVLFPFLLLIATQAAVLVPALYGHAWEGAVVPTELLAVAGLPAAILSGTGPIVLAAGRPDAIMRYNAVTLVSLGAALVIGSRMGLQGACAALAVFQLLNLCGAQYYLLGRTVGIPFADLAHDAGPAAVSSLPLVLVAGLGSVGLDAAGVPAFVNLPLVTAVALAAYGLVMRRLFPESWADLRVVIDRLLPRPRVPILTRKPPTQPVPHEPGPIEQEAARSAASAGRSPGLDPTA